MKYQRNTVLEDQLLEELMEEIEDKSRAERQPSVTSLIYCLTKSWYDAKSPATHSRKTKLFFTTGLGLEKALLVGRRSNAATSGQLDGIYYHIDSLDGGDSIPLMELKSTRRRASSKAKGDMDPEQFSEGWLKQAKAYCKTQGQTKVSFVILHIIEPELVAWDVEFTQDEIDDNWGELLARKVVLDMAKERDEAPEPYKWNMGQSSNSWECQSCPYAALCEARSMSTKWF